MKSKLWIFLITVILLFLVSCNVTPSNDPDEDPGKPNEVEDTEDGEVETMYIDGTQTLQAQQLWTQKDETKVVNLTLDEDQHITLENDSSPATYESLPIEMAQFDELVLS